VGAGGGGGGGGGGHVGKYDGFFFVRLVYSNCSQGLLGHTHRARACLKTCKSVPKILKTVETF